MHIPSLPAWSIRMVIPAAILILWPCVGLAAPVITEVMWSGSDVSTSDEWLEIAGLDTVTDLTGWTVTSVNGSGVETVIARFATGSTVAPDQFLVISHFAAGQSRLSEAPFLVSSSVTLPNTKLLLRLRARDGSVVDTVDDGVGTPFAGINATGTGARASMERVSLLGSGTDSANWATAVTSRGWDNGIPIFGTPGFARGSTAGQESASSSSQSQSSESPSVSQSSSSAESSAFSSQERSSSSSFEQIFSSSIESSTRQSSSSSSVEQSSESSFASSLSAAFSSSSTAASQSSVSFSAVSSPIFSSSASSIPRLQLSEVLADPAGSETGQWIEVANLDAQAISLHGWALRFGSKTFALPSSNTLEPGAFLSFRRPQTSIVLQHSGGTVQLVQGSTLVDSFFYGKTGEGISVGRNMNTNSIQSYCVPTEAAPNDQESSWDADLRLQSGQTEADGKVSVNLEVVVTHGASTGMICSVNFGDGTTLQGCNPPSHTIEKPGTYSIKASITNYCGTTIERTIPVIVHGVSSSSSSSVSSRSSSSLSYSSQSVNNGSNVSIGDIIIQSAIPNPAGTDAGRETVELLNRSSFAIDLQGWALQIGTRQEKLVGVIQSHQPLTIVLRSLNLPNNGAILLLVDPSGAVRSQLSWTTVGDGVVVRTIPFTIRQRVKGMATHVIDGDTFDAILEGSDISWRVRLLGVDAPELKAKASDDKSIDGINALNYLRELIENKKIELEFDTELMDMYGRLLGYVRAADGQSVQELMLKGGFAKIYTKAEFSKKNEYLALQQNTKGTQQSSKSFSSSTSSAMKKYSPVPVTGFHISEIYANPSVVSTGEKNYLNAEWIEFRNDSQNSIDLANVRIRIGDSGKPHALTQSSSLLQPQALIVIFAHQLGLKLNNEGQKLSILGPDSRLLETVEFPKLKKGQSYGVGEDGTWCIQSALTPGLNNKCVHKTLAMISSPAKKSTSLLYAQEVVDDLEPIAPSASGGVLIAESGSMSLLSDESKLTGALPLASLSPVPSQGNGIVVGSISIASAFLSTASFLIMKRFGS